ncbi:MAG: Asp-tRNA(Asn)/Glu-tRNA(Gln) amidotransferase subunit GatB [Patescibacteria group bacterium]|nr:Asp-tRNA(Asn)/Glu-tRNA(Gln) amidotransferase subunit GatB [Patescibacteria group bacterium]
MKYYTTIGLEVHAELKTKSKMFCSCLNDPNEKKPNINICPICLAHPGTLPVANKEAIKSVIKVGLALNSKIANFTEFDRKNYFYPDIPKGYQISQYKYPIVEGGKLNGVKITRVHLEEDTGTSKHDRGNFSLIDFNRAGVPLMELVTEPVIHSAKQAGDFGRELQLLLKYLDVSNANMEKGEMRVELNISISADPKKLGTKVEVKNLNSFKAVEKAAEFEIKRMTALLKESNGDKIVQETRGWNEFKQKTFSQRKKENSHDYRYFPDPDIPKFYLDELFNIKEIKLPELPAQKRERYKKEYGIKDEDIESYILDFELGEYFEKVANSLDKEEVKTASNYITSDYLGLKKNSPKIELPAFNHFVELIKMVKRGEISSRTAKDILALIVVEDNSPKIIAAEKGLLQDSDEESVKKIVQKIIKENPKVVEIYKKGKENAVMSLVGQVMKETKGSANPKIVLKLLKELL